MPHLRYLDLDSHGYSIVDVDRDRVRFEWWTVDGLGPARARPGARGAMAVRHGEPRLIAEETPAPDPAAAVPVA